MAVPIPSTGKGIKTMVFDFDGVLAVNVWPDPRIGPAIPLGIQWAKEYFEMGMEVVIYTARPESHRDAIKNWCQWNGLWFIYDIRCGKPLGAGYVDDRAIVFPPVEQALEELEVAKVRCAVPPEGWECSRDAGHDGPCAARVALTSA